MATKLYTIHKSGDNYVIYFRGTRAEGPPHATRKTAEKYARIIGIAVWNGADVAMTKKTFIALADDLIGIKKFTVQDKEQTIRCGQTIMRRLFTDEQFNFICELLADFCQSQNPRFNRERWLGYIAGKCGPSGGTKQQA